MAKVRENINSPTAMSAPFISVALAANDLLLSVKLKW